MNAAMLNAAGIHSEKKNRNSENYYDSFTIIPRVKSNKQEGTGKSMGWRSYDRNIFSQ